VLGREEEMLYGCPRGAERHYVKDAVMRDGRIVARKVTSYFDAGAYTRLSSYGAVKCIAHVPGPYTIPNVHADSFCVFTNRAPATAMRGFGITGLDFSLEVQMDKLAHKVGMDPMEFRILNAYRDGDMKAHRREAHNCALIECVQVAAEKAGWPIRDEYRRMNSLTGGGGERAIIPATATDEAGRIGARRPAGRTTPPSRAPAIPISPPPRVPQPVAAQPRVAPPPRPAAAPAPSPPSAAPPPREQPKPAAPASTPQHGVTRFSSVFGTRRR
jgi:Molybdopterin-binding domain of aldehyde dehydrogenase